MEARAYAKAQAEQAQERPSGPGRFEQAYNAQAAVEIESRLIVGTQVTQATNDKAQLGPTVAAIAPVVTSVKEVLVDSGFVSEAATTRLETETSDHSGEVFARPRSRKRRKPRHT